MAPGKLAQTFGQGTEQVKTGQTNPDGALVGGFVGPPVGPLVGQSSLSPALCMAQLSLQRPSLSRVLLTKISDMLHQERHASPSAGSTRGKTCRMRAAILPHMPCANAAGNLDRH